MSNTESILDRIVAAIDAEKLGAYGVHVLVGEEGAQHRWRSDDRVNIYSASKAVCALAIGIAIEEGVLALESTTLKLLPDMRLGAGVDLVTVRNLLTMTSGIDFEWFGDKEVPWPDLAQEMLARPARGPGTHFQYTDVSTYVLMRMLGAVVGDVRDWLMPRLFDPLEVHNPQWFRCPLGFIIGGSGLYLTTEELARIGQLLRDGGRWRGVQLVPEAWVAQMRSSWVKTGWGDSYADYGFGVWNGPGNCWRLDGKYGQYVIIDQALDRVVTITAHEEERDHRLAKIAHEIMTN